MMLIRPISTRQKWHIQCHSWLTRCGIHIHFYEIPLEYDLHPPNLSNLIAKAWPMIICEACQETIRAAEKMSTNK